MITSLFAGVLWLLFFAITMKTIKARRSNSISLGDGDSGEISGVVSAHSNFSSYAIFFLFLMFLVEELSMTPRGVLYFLGTIFTIGRYLHFKALSGPKMNFKFRVLGMHMTLWPSLGLSLILIGNYFYESFWFS